MSDKYSQFYGQAVDVVSGPHEGRSGRVMQIVDGANINGAHVDLGEPYAIIEFQEKDCFNDVRVDHISVPIRRCTLKN